MDRPPTDDLRLITRTEASDRPLTDLLAWQVIHETERDPDELDRVADLLIIAAQRERDERQVVTNYRAGRDLTYRLHRCPGCRP